MKIRFFSRFTLHSLIAMAISWVISVILVVTYDGLGKLNEMLDYGMLWSSFVLITWTFFIFPIVKFINLLLHKSRLRIYFPIFTAFYSLIIFVIVFSFVLDMKIAINMIVKGNIFAITAGLIGGLWGVLYMLLYMFEIRRAYVS